MEAINLESCAILHAYSIFFLMVCMVYTFAIVGMEVFGGEENTVYPGCWWVALHIYH